MSTVEATAPQVQTTQRTASEPEPLFTPYRLDGLELKNRLVLSPMTLWVMVALEPIRHPVPRMESCTAASAAMCDRDHTMERLTVASSSIRQSLPMTA